MAIEGIFYVYVSVRDMARAKQFYGDILGWQLGTDEPQAAGFAFGSGYLVAGLEDQRASAPQRGDGMHVSVKVTDIEAQYARLKSHGIAVSEIVQHPWGERNFSFTDPDGHEWKYGQGAG